VVAAVEQVQRLRGRSAKLSTILIVDDDPSTRFVMRIILERDGHEIVEADHGQKALELIGPDPLPDVVTTDVRMPVLNGVELIRRLRSEPRTAAIPIIVVSSDPDAVHGLRAAGLVDAILTKPFDAAQFTECVRYAAQNTMNESTLTQGTGA
jgi:CheY-like chemotaxis protein